MEIKLKRDDLDEEKETRLEVEENTTVKQLLKKRDIPIKEVLVSRNGTVISDKHELEDGDEIKVFDVIAGG